MMTKNITKIKSHQYNHSLFFNFFTGVKSSWPRIAFLFFLSLTCSIFLTSSYAGQTSKTYSESSIKAALVYNILHFIEWQTNTLTICVYGQNEEDVSSFKSLPSQTKSGNTLDVIFLRTNGDSIIQNDCHIIFISRDKGDDIYEILNESKKTQRLTIGESDRFITQGGMINFVRKDLTIKFEVNISALKQAGLEISSQVLRIADRVYAGDNNE